ncbi:filamin-A isoform X2 [Adelges cooleyi]|nr:filamin-A isoform X2 [Adelges cooleyi]
MSGGGFSPKLSVIGDAVKLIPVDSVAIFQISAIGYHREDVQVNVLSPTKRNVQAKIINEGGNGIFRIEFLVIEVGTHLVDVSVAGHKLGTGTLLAKGYNSALIRVTDVTDAVVGQPCQFRVDASDAGEGQLEISINEGEVPNHVTVVGGGRCLVSFTPEHVKPHMIDIKFNSETVIGCPFVCSVSDTSRVSVNLSRLELIPVNQVAKFHMMVDNSASAELSVSVTGPSTELPVKVTGNVNIGFTAEFTPQQVGAHSISVEYNGHPVNGTPYVAKAYDASKVLVGNVPKGHVGNSYQFTVDASEAGEGNLEITISARGANIPTQVHPQGNAKFAVSFLPLQPTDHVITIHFNKESVPGSPFIAHVEGDLPLVSGSSLTCAPVSSTSHFTMSNVSGSLDDIEVNVEGPNGSAVPAQVKESGTQSYKIEFCPKIVGEHKIAVSYLRTPVAGSPFSCKVYDINAIKVKSVPKGTIGQQVTFIVETSQAGPGNLEVTVNGGRVPTSAQAQGPHTYAISFTPRQPTIHTVHLRFNNHDVPGSPFTCSVTEAARVVVWSATEDKVSVGKIASFAVQCESSPQVQVLAPLRHSLPVTVIPASQPSTHNVQFTPIDVGDHSVEVKVDGIHVEGSPFLVKAYDASKVQVTDINTGFVGKPVNFNINASEAGAGNLEIIVSVNGVNVPNYVQSEGNAKFRVNFKPREPAPHSLSVRFNGEPIPGSPLTCRVLDIDQVAVTGTGVKYCAVKKTADIKIESPDISNDTNFKINVFSPTGQVIDVKTTIMANAIGAYFTPNEIGRHIVEIFIEGQMVDGSPFSCNVYNINHIKVTGLGTAKAGKPVTFSVDATEAGEGTLELVVSSQRGTVKAEVVACSRGLYDVTFVPHNPIPHFVNITFNDEIVPGSPYSCEVLDLNGVRKGATGSSITAYGEGLQRVKLGYPARFDINPHIADHGSITVNVKGPENKTVPVNLHKHDSGLYRVSYRPTAVGLHMVTILHRNQPISKHPWKVQVIEPELVAVSGLNESICNKPASFKVDTRNAGKGELSVVIKAAGRDVKLKTTDVESNGIHQVAYQPVIPVPHYVHVKYNNYDVHGSPFMVNVREQIPSTSAELRAIGHGLYQSVVNKMSSFIIDSTGKSSHEFDVVITGPQHTAVPAQCYQHKNGMNLIVEFTPTKVGQHNIEVTHFGKHLKGSPFSCYVYNAGSVKIIDLPEKNSAVVHRPVSFKLLRKNAGLADFTVTCLGPDNEDVPVDFKNDGEDIDGVQIIPTVPGDYIFNILYGKEHITESPLKVNVADPGVPRVWGSGRTKALKDVTARFFIASLGTSYHTTPIVTVRSGNDIVPVTVIQSSSGQEGEYEVSFTPYNVGVCEISIVWNGRHVGDSPCRCTVIDINKIITVGEPNLNERLILGVNAPTTLTFDTSAAGPGELEGRLESQGGMKIPIIIDSSGNTAKCVLTPHTSGPHVLHLSYEGFPLPNSPYPVLVESGAAGVRVVLSGSGLTSATCGQPAEFTIDGSQAGPGNPVVTLAGSRNEIPVNVVKAGENLYHATYSPVSPGAYLLNVLWGHRQVKGCPMKINVTGVCDASKVLCTGDGLGIGTVGKDIRSFIDTRRAGPGELSAHCIGPHKVAYCELYDHGDGTFTLNVKPQESGRHTLTVKYAGEDVPGSPFTVRVSGAPDASKVRVYGPGIEHGVLAIFQSRFICDTRGAGAGQLTVRVRGPKGAFRVEMQRENQKDRTILCKFDPTEPGDYRVEVKWAGEHVPGSPFMVMIFDTQEELNRYLQGNHSPVGSDLYSSVNYSSSYAHITP